MSKNLLEIKNLTSAFLFDGKPVPVIFDVSYELRYGEVLGIVGESGSGKSVTAKNVMRLLPSPPASVLGGEIILDGESILEKSEKEMLKIRGNKVAMIFQEPMTSLNPVYTCGDQIMEAVIHHQHVSRAEAHRRAVEMLDLVGIPSPEARMKSYPHELSGGMRQRVMIAMALCCNPKLLIADEPTTALDPTIQAQIIELLKDIREKVDMSIMYITHDLSVVAEICDRVVVMYAGMVQEIADVHTLFYNPLHPYTLGLMQAMPRLGKKKERLYNIPGVVPHITQMPEGCHFAPRCPYATDECRAKCPELRDAGEGHMVRCFHYEAIRDEEDRKGE